ncbi:MAG: hypothetical protein JJU15_08600 [Pararhodobacter sp.]|nr:hypothetical protein [Pararhodobacter sp.]
MLDKMRHISTEEDNCRATFMIGMICEDRFRHIDNVAPASQKKGGENRLLVFSSSDKLSH